MASTCFLKAAELTEEYKYNLLFHLQFLAEKKEYGLIILFLQHKLLELIQLTTENGINS